MLKAGGHKNGIKIDILEFAQFFMLTEEAHAAYMGFAAMLADE
jgi:hypothetical protein